MAVTITPNAGDVLNRNIKITLDAGDTSAAIFVSRQTVVTGYPGSGGTIRAEATWSLESEVNAGTARWQDWDGGAATAKYAQVLQNATAVRFIAATQSAVCEVAR